MKVARGSTAWFRMCWNSVTSLSLSLSSMTETSRGEASLAKKLP